jgi:hypothetical protein
MDWGAMIAVISAIGGIALAWLGRARSVKRDVAQEAGAGASLQTDVEYIDDIKVDLQM